MKLKQIISNIYEFILKRPFFNSLVVLLPCIYKDSLIRELYVVLLISFLFSFNFQKRYKAKEIFLFGLWFSLVFILRDIIIFILSSKSSGFTELTLIFYGQKILILTLLKSIARFISGSFILFIVNIISVKIINLEKIKKYTTPIINLIQSPIKLFILFMIIVFSFNIINYFSSYHMDNKIYTELNSYNPQKIEFLNENNILLVYADRIAIYDRTAGKIIDKKRFMLNENSDYRINDMQYIVLKNSNILIKTIYNNSQNGLRGVLIWYSPNDKKILTLKELPAELTESCVSITELNDGNILLLGAKISNTDKYTGYIVNENTQDAIQTNYLNGTGRYAKTLKLPDGRIFILDNDSQFAEIYDPEKDVYTKAEFNFILEKRNNVCNLPNGKVLISAEKLNSKQEDGIGTYVSGFYGTGYPAPFLVIYNPKDNSFKEIDINKNDKKNLKNDYSIAVTKEGKLIILGGEYIGRKKFIPHGDNMDITIYDTNTDKLKKGSKKLKYNRIKPSIYAVDNRHIIVYSGRAFMNHPQDNSDFAEEIILK